MNAPCASKHHFCHRGKSASFQDYLNDEVDSLSCNFWHDPECAFPCMCQWSCCTSSATSWVNVIPQVQDLNCDLDILFQHSSLVPYLLGDILDQWIVIYIIQQVPSVGQVSATTRNISSGYLEMHLCLQGILFPLCGGTYLESDRVFVSDKRSVSSLFMAHCYTGSNLEVMLPC